MTSDDSPEREDGGEQREEPQHRAAVDHQQDEDHDDAGRVSSSVTVQAGERIDERGQQAAGAGRVHRQPGRCAGLGRGDHRVFVVGQIGSRDRDPVLFGNQRHVDRRCGVVAENIGAVSACASTPGTRRHL